MYNIGGLSFGREFSCALVQGPDQPDIEQRIQDGSPDTSKSQGA